MDNISKVYELMRNNDVQNNYDIHKSAYENNFVRLKKIICKTDDEKEKYDEILNETELLISSISFNKKPFNYVILGKKEENKINVLYSNEINNETIVRLKSAYTGVDLENYSLDDNIISKLKYSALITGIPLLENENSEKNKFTFDFFIKSMIGKNFALKTSFKPVDEYAINGVYEKLLRERSNNSKDIKVSLNTSKAETSSESYRDGENETKNNSGGVMIFNRQEGTGKSWDTTKGNNTTITTAETHENIDYFNETFDELLDIQIKRVKDMVNSTAWEASIMIYAETEAELQLAINSYKSCFKGKLLEKIRVHDIGENISILNNVRIRDKEAKRRNLYGYIVDCINLYKTEEIAAIINPYWEEVNGFNIVKRPQFTQQCYEKNDIYIGNILNYGSDTGIEFSIGKNDLNKHLLVAGITGSGKTNTVFSLVRSLQLPFLVIEPAKTEYRKLKTQVKDLRVYTLGREQYSPFRINPFKFKNNSISLQEHIDNLKVIFTAAFTMYASMPNILEQCLVNVYTKKGWSLITSKNIFANDEIYDELYPTIEDLYTEIDSYINSLGYAQEQNQNIRAALLTRIKSMMTGSKGFMLNTTKSIDIEELLSYPTVIELEGIADDEEKALIIGFIMINIYEYLKGQDNGGVTDLNHIIIMEEAHRLFANISSNENQEMVNTRGKAVETLSNILCEIRAYGEGFIIVDQVPTKLAPDVLKNTNVKIIHRLVSKDDCEYISKSIQIKDEDVDFISRLKVGEALTYSEKLEDTAHIKINFNKDKYKYYSNLEVKEFSKEYNDEIFANISLHPLAETLLNYDNYRNQIKNVTKEFVKLCLENDIDKIQNIYNDTSKKYLEIVYTNGFDVDSNCREFVDDIIRRSTKMVINESKLSNNIYKSTFINKYINSIIELVKLDKSKHYKAYKALEKARRDSSITAKDILR